MKYIRQFCTIMAFSFFGELLHTLLPLRVPAGIYGIVLLFLALELKLLPYEKVKDTGHYLLDIMLVLFVPAGVGIMQTWDIIRGSLLQYILAASVSTLLVMAVSGKAAQIVIDLTGSGESGI